MQLGVRLDAQAGAVGVGTDQAQAAFQHRALAQLDGDEGGVIAGDVITATAFDTPGLTFVEAHITGGFQALGQAAGGVEGGGRGLEEIDQALVQLFAHWGTPDSSGGSLSHRARGIGGRAAVNFPYRPIVRGRPGPAGANSSARSGWITLNRSTKCGQA
ncbi:hypothetical protein D9M70_555500 [compost metagenome]